MRDYLTLTKPGIIGGNLLVAAAGFMFASVTINWLTFVVTLLGLTCVVASACVFNNWYDCDIDAKMVRTRERPNAAGRISSQNTILFGSVLLLVGVGFFLFTSMLAFDAALLGFIIYVFAYTPLKHRSGYALYAGSLAGAMPPIVGYTAAASTLDWRAAVLFAFLFMWQLPHFISIALYRYDEYRAAGVPLLVSEPSEHTQKRARKVFFATLIVLTFACLAIFVAHPFVA